MNEVEPGQNAVPAPSERAGDVLRAAREAQGLSLADVGARTRVPLRHLEAIEQSDYAALPASTYAVGFSRAYARAVGADEVHVAQLVREDVARIGRRAPEYEPYEMTDPSRVPSRGLTIGALGVALAVLVLVGLWYGTGMFRSTGTMSDAPAASIATAVPAAKPVAPPAPSPANGQVVLVASDEVWMRVYDADNKTLYLGTMKPGERYEVPRDAKDPMINVGRPDKLAVTLNGSAVPPLGTGERAIKDVRIGATALGARIAGTPQPEASTTSGAGTEASATTRSANTSRANRPRPTSVRRALTETQRANLDAAATAPPAGNASAP